MSYLRYLCMLANSGVQHILSCVFAFFSSSCSFSGLSVVNKT
jgi:hypothetical protein